jgi:hypothetical protein
MRNIREKFVPRVCLQLALRPHRRWRPIPVHRVASFANDLECGDRVNLDISNRERAAAKQMDLT